MKATHKYKNIPVTHISIRFRVTPSDIDFAVIALVVKGLKPTKKAVYKEVRDIFHSGGADAASDWVHEDDFEKCEKLGKEIARKLFPTFYNS